MDYIRFAISNPVKVTVAVLMLLLFGFLALMTIPIQMTPNVDKPIITVETNWVGRSPEQVERDILEEQEDKLKGIANLKKMESVAQQGHAEITLEFYIGTDMSRALQEVSDKLREVPEYPADVDEPVIVASDSASDEAVAWLVLYSGEPGFDVQGFYDLADKRIKPIIERVEGISTINIYGGRERQVHIRIDPYKLAQRGITFNQLRSALQTENVDVSAGEMQEGRLNIRVRTVGQYDNLDDIRQTIVTYTDGGPVRIGDLGDVVLTLEKRRSFVRSKQRPALAFQVVRETGANIIKIMEGDRNQIGLKQRIVEINRDLLPTLGPKLTLEQVYDETVYVHDAIGLVKDNLFIGGALAGLMLLMFLRTIRPTIIVLITIPISVIGTFVVMAAFGRTLNVISLAGLAFAVGMVVDNAIVVLENIDRHLIMGKKPAQAAYDATKEVWGAILASSLTTLAVFVPVLTIQEEAGQLFRDISLAICAAVTLSLIVSITVIPMASSRFLRVRREAKSAVMKQASDLFGLAKLMGKLNRGIANLLHSAMRPDAMGVGIRLGVVAGFTLFAMIVSYVIMPPASYMPNGNRNLVFGGMLTPPGYNLDQNSAIGESIEATLAPYWNAKDYSDTAKLPPAINFMTGQPYPAVAPIEQFFYVSFRSTIFMGAISADKNNVAPLASLLTLPMNQVPGSFGGANQLPLFGGGLSGANAIDVEISCSDLDRLRNTANILLGSFMEQYGMSNMRWQPMNFNLPGPELQVKIDRVKAADLGIDVAALGLGVQALVDGSIIGDYRHQGETLDLLMIRHPDYTLSAEMLAEVPVAARDLSGNVVGVLPLSSVASLDRTQAPQEITRIEQFRSVKLTVTPPAGMPLQTVTDDIAKTVQDLRDSGAITPDVEVNMAGTADKLTQVRRSLIGQFDGPISEQFENLLTSRLFLALLITYLLMAALFESFLYPFVIMFSVPLATLGGFLGLAIVRIGDPMQQLDVLTMLGFVILIGVVVNNAILLVHQALNFMRGVGETDLDKVEKMAPREAIREAVHTRMRPIFMTTATSVFGMLPLVLRSGSGSELYQGLGSVVIGGLIVATVFTLIVVPLVFSLTLDLKVRLYRSLGWPVAEIDGVAEIN